MSLRLNREYLLPQLGELLWRENRRQLNTVPATSSDYTPTGDQLLTLASRPVLVLTSAATYEAANGSVELMEDWRKLGDMFSKLERADKNWTVQLSSLNEYLEIHYDSPAAKVYTVVFGHDDVMIDYMIYLFDLKEQDNGTFASNK